MISYRNLLTNYDRLYSLGWDLRIFSFLKIFELLVTFFNFLTKNVFLQENNINLSAKSSDNLW